MLLILPKLHKIKICRQRKILHFRLAYRRICRAPQDGIFGYVWLARYILAKLNPWSAGDVPGIHLRVVGLAKAPYNVA